MGEGLLAVLLPDAADEALRRQLGAPAGASSATAPIWR